MERIGYFLSPFRPREREREKPELFILEMIQIHRIGVAFRAERALGLTLLYYLFFPLPSSRIAELMRRGNSSGINMSISLTTSISYDNLPVPSEVPRPPQNST